MRTKMIIAQCCSRAAFGQLRMSSTTTPTHDDLDAVFKQKRLIRTQVRKTLKSIQPSLRSHQGITNLSLRHCLFHGLKLLSVYSTFHYFPDNAVQDIVLEAPWFKSSRRLCAYISCAALREVDTFKILSQILQHNGTNCRKNAVIRIMCFFLRSCC